MGFSESILMMTAPGRQMENGKASREGAGGSGRKPEMELWGICVSSVAERACWSTKASNWTAALPPAHYFTVF